MTGRRTWIVVAVAVVAAAALAVIAGMSGGATGPDEDSAAKGRATAGASPSPGGTEKGTGEGGEEGEAGRRDRDSGGKASAKVPKSELSPATGSFTKKEKGYLVGRVPEGMEPAAVLEAGETACARIATAADVSEKDVVSALRKGEIDQAEPAVKHLCPRFAPLLEKAGKGEGGG